MKPTTNKENVSYSMTTQHGNTKTTRSIAVDMPICDECLKHRSQYNWLLVLICFISIAIGSVFMAILMAAEADGFLSFILGAGLTIGSYYILSAIWKTKPLSKEHSTRGKSARIFSLFLGGLALRNMPNLSNVTFTFYNWEYAQLFREANGDTASDVKEANETNTAKTTSVLKANEHPVANMFKMIGVFVAIALLIGMIFESANSGSDYNSNSNTNGYTNNDYDYDYDYTPSPNYDSGNSTKANQLKSEIEDLKDEIDDMEWDLEQLSDDIDYYERQYYNTGYDFYANNYDDAVDDYNDLYAEYTEAIDNYNDKVNEYNRLICAN